MANIAMTTRDLKAEMEQEMNKNHGELFEPETQTFIAHNEEREEDLHGDKLGIREINRRFGELEERLKIVELAYQGGCIGKKVLDPTKFISKGDMVEMILHAISKGNSEFGVSRSFIRKVVCDQNTMEMNSYRIKKINSCLQTTVESGLVVFDPTHQLYKLA